jgi:hypothetical protein
MTSSLVNSLAQAARRTHNRLVGALWLAAQSAVFTNAAAETDLTCKENLEARKAQARIDPGFDAPAPSVQLVSASQIRVSKEFQTVILGTTSRWKRVQPDALYLEEKQLAGLARSTHTPLAIVGSGLNDFALARRVFRWQRAEGNAVVIRGGMPALALESGNDFSDEHLARLLAVDSQYQIALAYRSDWALIVLDGAETPKAISTIGVSRDLDQTVKKVLRNGLSGVALVDETGSLSQSGAVELSRRLRHPIFYFVGGAAQLRSEFVRFEALDRPADHRRHEPSCQI